MAISAPPEPIAGPWETSSRPPGGIGICLSGGGLRAASFSLGVLQVLQQRLGLIEGERSAQYLAAVSGGSYVAAAYVLGAKRRSKSTDADGDPPVLAPGSPEETYILSHATYLERDRLRFVGLAAVNLASLAVLFVWIGAFVAIYALMLRLITAEYGADALADIAAAAARLPIWLLIAAALVAFTAIRVGLYSEGGWRRIVLPLLGIAVLIATSQPLFEWLAMHPDWWSWWPMAGVLGLIFVVTVLVTLATWVARRVGVSGPPAAWLNRLTVYAPRALGFTLLTWDAIWWYGMLRPITLGEEPEWQTAALFAVNLVAPLIFGLVPHRASLHREYRRRVALCFAVRRDGTSVVTGEDPLLSDLTPPTQGQSRFPRLMICATANVRVEVPGREPLSYASFVFSHDRCWVPGRPEANFATRQLELLREPGGLLTTGTEPLTSLFTAVAATGAAVSPSMGRQTYPSARMLIAAFNIRLGRWLPNPFNSRERERIAALSCPEPFGKGARMGAGYDELIREMLGLDGPHAYISDGGHYDNLGLLALLHAKCAEIWCVDASPEPAGQAAELVRVLAVAAEELDIKSRVDLKTFASGPDGLYQSTHAVGKVEYADGTECRLVIIKLGLTPGSPPHLLARRRTDPGFPHHSTFGVQVYPTDRMDAYRRLGNDAATRCLNGMRA